MQIDTKNIRSLCVPVVGMLLSGDSEFLSALKLQFATAEIDNIIEDGYGIFINFSINADTRIISPDIEYARVDGLVGVNEDMEWICGFALFIENGRLVQLDGFPYSGDQWPQEIVSLKFISVDKDGIERYSDKRSARSLERYNLKDPIILEKDASGMAL